MQKIKIGGVPEHFNYPWNYAIENGWFEKEGFSLHWNEFPGGTGAMAQALKDDELDIAIMLTEGAVKEIVGNAPFKIALPYVTSPLVWGIHTSLDNKKASIQNIENQKIAISRWGSGSHLMAYVYAKSMGTNLQQDKMVLVGNLEGARKALLDGTADLFFWEKFMTKPYVDNQEFKLLGEFPTPWPCFMYVAKNDFAQKNVSQILRIHEILKKCILTLLNTSELESHISDRFKLRAEDVKAWLNITKWATDNIISSNHILEVINTLKDIKMINSNPAIQTLFHPTAKLT